MLLYYRGQVSLQFLEIALRFSFPAHTTVNMGHRIILEDFALIYSCEIGIELLSYFYRQEKELT